MKKLTVLFIITAGLAYYAYEFLYLADLKQNMEKQIQWENPIPPQGIIRVLFSQADRKVSLIKKGELWWVETPFLYPADQEFIAKTLGVMTSTPPMSQFSLKDDRYGFNPGRALVELQYENTRRIRLVVGEVLAPQNGLYVLNKDEELVYSFHNIWGQGLYYGIDRFRSQLLPFPDKEIRALSFLKGGTEQWALKIKDGHSLVATKGQSSKTQARAPWVWFFKQLGEISLSDHRLQGEEPLTGSELRVTGAKSNIKFVFDEKAGRIFIPSLKVFAQFEPGSLRSLHNEFNKVFDSDKK